MRPILIQTLVGPAATVSETGEDGGIDRIAGGGGIDKPFAEGEGEELDGDGWPIFRILTQESVSTAGSKALKLAQVWHAKWGHSGTVAEAVGVWPA